MAFVLPTESKKNDYMYLDTNTRLGLVVRNTQRLLDRTMDDKPQLEVLQDLMRSLIHARKQLHKAMELYHRDDKGLG